MVRRVLLALLALLGIAAAVHAYRVVSWWQWHGEQQGIDRAIDEAINAPGGGDYARAVDIVRSSSRPDATKRFQVGRLIVGAYAHGSRRPPPETPEAGVRMMEDFAASTAPEAASGVQALRLLFERGVPQSVRRFPTDPVVADCWRAIERRQAADPARCVALRRRRLPDIGTTG